MYTPTNSPRQNTTGRALVASILLAIVALGVLATSLPATATDTTDINAASVPSTVASQPAATRPVETAPVSAPAGEPHTTTITGADADTRTMIEELIDMYAAAGLELPALRINVHATNEGCDGHQGLYRKGGDLYRIDICTVHPTTVAHELAHAWERHTVAESTRTEFMARVGGSKWNDQEAAHPVRAIERAADVIAWGIQEQPIQRLLASHHAEELEQFEMLTGRPSPRIAHWNDPIENVARPLPAAAAAATSNSLPS